MQQPLVSFIVPAFNARHTIDKTLQSIVSQELPQWEAIIVDDGSTDGTARHCGRWIEREPRFRLVRQRNAGASAARNVAIKAARGRWLVFLDADDWIADDFLSVMWPLVKGKPDNCLAYCAYVRVSPTGEHLPPDFCHELTETPFEFLAERCEPAIHCVIISRQLVLDVGGFDPKLATCEDWDLWLRVARRGAQFIGCDAPLAFYRMRDGSLSSNNEHVDRDALLVLQRAACSDPRVAAADPRYVNGKPKDATTAAIDWRSYIVALDSGQGVVQPLTLEADWIEAVGDIAFAVLTLVADKHQSPLSSLPALGSAATEQYQRYAALVEQAVPLPGFGLLLESKANRLALMETDLSVPTRSGDWLGAELDLTRRTGTRLPHTDAKWILIRVRRGDVILGYVDIDANTEPARAVLDGLSLVQLIRTPTLLASPAFWRGLVRESCVVGVDQASRLVRRHARGRTVKGMARQALRAAAHQGLQTSLSTPEGVRSLNGRAVERGVFPRQPPPALPANQFQLPVVVYRIDQTEPALSDDDGISLDAIRSQLTYLRRTGYRPLSTRQLRAHIVQRRPVSPKQVVIVFEAATRDQLEQLRPVLADTDFTYVACPRPGPQFEQVLSLIDSGKLGFSLELGVSVSPLHTFPPHRQTLESAVKVVLGQGQTALACLSAIPPHELLVRQLCALGVELVVGAGSGVVDVENCSLTLPRIQVTHGESLGMFAEKLRCSSWTV